MSVSQQFELKSPVPFQARVLGVGHVLYATANGLAFGTMIAMYAFLLLSPLRNSSENDGNLSGLLIMLAAFPLGVIVPMLGGFGLLLNRRWARSLIGFSCPLTFLLILAITFIWVWELEEPVALAYGIPALLMSVYAGWYVWRTPAG